MADEENIGDCNQENISKKRFQDSNKKLFIFFQCVGLYLHKFDENTNKYELYTLRYVISYLAWYMWPCVGLGIAFAGIVGFQLDDGVSEVDNGVEASLYILGFAVVPAFQIYVIKLISENIPIILMEMQNLKPFHGLKFDNEVSLMMWLKLNPYRKYKKYKNNISRQTVKNNILRIMPQLSFFLPILAFLIAFIIGFFDVVKMDNVKPEWPYFVIQFFYMSFPAVSTWFCVAFLSWHCQNYKAIQKFVKKEEKSIIKKMEQKKRPVSRGTIKHIMESEQNHINDLGEYVDRLQYIFSMLANRILKYTFGINFMVFVISNLFCTYKIFSNKDNVFYTVPVFISLFHLFISCERGNLLMYQYNKTVEEVDKILTKLNRRMQSKDNPRLLRKISETSITSNAMDESNMEDIEEREKHKNHLQDSYNKVQRLLENLRLSKPQVTCFNSLKVNYNTFAAIVGFIVSYVGLVLDLTGCVCDCDSSQNNNSIGYQVI